MSKVAIIMGSKSDLPVMQEAIDILKGFDIEVEVDIVSAHRTPEKLFDFSTNAHKRGYFSDYSRSWRGCSSSWNGSINESTTYNRCTCKK